MATIVASGAPPTAAAPLMPQAQGTAVAQASATARAAATATAYVNATATAQAVANANATATVEAREQWPVVLTDSFSRNAHDWPEGRSTSKRFGTTTYSITKGKYHWASSANDSVIWWSYPNVDMTSDFYLKVEAQQQVWARRSATAHESALPPERLISRFR